MLLRDGKSPSICYNKSTGYFKEGIYMPETYEKNGVIYFREPYKINFTQWLESHLDCDSVVKSQMQYSPMGEVICYAKDKKYNVRLQEEFAEMDSNLYALLRCLSTEEINSIG